MDKIIAIVVSYNRHSLLTECIDALRKQTRKPDAILVVNNGSVDYTSVWLDQQDDVIHLYQENAGSAGGYHTGMKWAYDHGYGLMWCMDDDGYPAPDALEILLFHRSYETEMLNCAVINKNDKKRFVSKTKKFKTLEEVDSFAIEGVCHPFNGTLIHRSIIEKAGLPLSELFYWGEEREYFYRVSRKYKIPVKTISYSVFYHPDLSHAQKKEWDTSRDWKMYFYIRNRYKVMQSRYQFKMISFPAYMLFFLRISFSVLLKQRSNKARKLVFLCWPFADALKNQFNSTPEQIIHKMNMKQQESVVSMLLRPVKKAILNAFVPSYSDGSKPALIEL